MVTREYLTAHIERMKTQIVAYNGAIEFAEFLLSQTEPDGLPIQQLAEAIAGPGATAEVMEMETSNAAV